jgi:hypothetical protein
MCPLPQRGWGYKEFMCRWMAFQWSFLYKQNNFAKWEERTLENFMNNETIWMLPELLGPSCANKIYKNKNESQ